MRCVGVRRLVERSACDAAFDVAYLPLWTDDDSQQFLGDGLEHGGPTPLGESEGPLARFAG